MTEDTLTSLRNQIDAIDMRLLALIGERQALVERVVAVKKRSHLPARIPERIAEVIGRQVAAAPAHGAAPALVETVWTAMIEWFIAHEERALAGDLDLMEKGTGKG
jgi:isochorismate pyruvate lyase